MNQSWNREIELAARSVDNTGTILLVEDESFVREVTCEILQSAGYRVRTATNAAEAKRIFSEYGTEIDVLITDIVLPGETGKVLAAKLRRENPWLRVLYITGYAQQMKTPANRWAKLLAKPFSSEALLETVKLIFQESECQREEDLVMPACVGA